MLDCILDERLKCERRDAQRQQRLRRVEVHERGEPRHDDGERRLALHWTILLPMMQMRNVIVGPGGRQRSATFQRDVRLGGNRAMTLQVNAVNLLNAVQWAGVDTNVNSPTFGQVTSVRPMRTITVSARFRY